MSAATPTRQAKDSAYRDLRQQMRRGNDGRDHDLIGMSERMLLGVRGAVGAEYWFSSKIGALVMAGAEYYPTGAPDIEPLIVTPSVGVRARM